MCFVKIIIITSCCLLSSGCASLSLKSMGCDFTQGTYNAAEDLQRQQQLYKNFDPNQMHQEDSSTIWGAGLINVVVGSGKRLIFGKDYQPCED